MIDESKDESECQPFFPVKLTAYMNNRGIGHDGRSGTGSFNIWGNTFPAEQLPAAATSVTVGGVPFKFPPETVGSPDNVRCRGQRVELPGRRADWIYLLAAAERRTEDPVLLHYAGGRTSAQWLRVSDFWPETPARFGETLAFQPDRMLYPRRAQPRMAPSIWRVRIAVTTPGRLTGLTLPENPAMHVFALTLLDEEAFD